jgi:hypothetical protein
LGKAVGLTKFTSKHDDADGRLELSCVEGAYIKRLDNDNNNRKRVLAVDDDQHLNQLLENI